MPDFSINLFYSYCHSDENHRKDMEKYLTLLRKEGVLKEWWDRKIIPGQKITEVIHQQLSKADIIVFIVSIDFLNSNACQEEWGIAKSLAKNSKKSLISIIVRECPWLEFDNMGDYLALPTDGKPVSTFTDKDSAWNDVYSGIKAVVDNIRSTFQLKDEFKNKISLLEFCSQTNEAFTLIDLFVFPKLIKQSDTVEDELLFRNSNDIINEKKIIIQGDNQSGKTTLCNHVFLEIIENNSPALLVDLNNIANKKPSIEVLRQCYSEEYKGDFDLWVSQTDKIIIFDNFSHFGNSIEHILFAESLFDTIIIMTSVDDYESYFKDDIRLLGLCCL